MITKHLHDFHFVMAEGMIESLKGLEMYKKGDSLSGVIVKILSLLGPVIGREHKWGERRFCL